MSMFKYRILQNGEFYAEPDDEIFDTAEEAEEGALDWLNDYRVGTDAMAFNGEEFDDISELDFEVFEI